MTRMKSKLNKLENLLQRHGIPLQGVIPLLVDLVSIPLGPRYAVVEGTPERRKQKTIEALVELLLTVSESQPLLFTMEDLHWIDPTTLEFLTVLIEQIPSAPILLVVTYRPEFRSPWPARPGLTQLTIGNLTSRQTADVVTRIAGSRSLPAEVIDHIVIKTGGVPLFAEELTKVFLESDLLEESGNQYVLARPLTSVTIPSTLQDSLMARLDKLGPAKDVAQLAAVIGREFTFQLLAAIAPLDEETLQTHLTSLTTAELVHQRGFFPRARFTFKHALVQDTAYASLLRTTARSGTVALPTSWQSSFLRSPRPIRDSWRIITPKLGKRSRRSATGSKLGCRLRSDRPIMKRSTISARVWHSPRRSTNRSNATLWSLSFRFRSVSPC